MVKGLFQTLLYRSGKTYRIDPELPSRLILKTLIRRLVMLTRGIVVHQRQIFTGTGCSFSNKRNISFGKNLTIGNRVKIDGYSSQKVILGDFVSIGDYTRVICTSHMSKYGIGLQIGNNSAIGQFSEFGAAGGIRIGSDVIMGSYISFHSENHNFDDTTKLIREQGVTSKGIVIGSNVWVGAKVTFLDGARVGDNCVIAAGAVVRGEFPDNSVIGGVPAKILKSR